MLDRKLVPLLRRALPALAVALALVAPARARAQDLGPTSGEKLLDEAIDTTRDQWYDRSGVDSIDWDGLRDRYLDEARAAASPLEAHHVVNHLLGELHTSHLALLEGDMYDRELAPEFAGKRTARGGFELTRLPDGYFVSLVYEASPAAKAGLVVGDEVLAIDGTPTAECGRLEEAGHDAGYQGPGGFVLAVDGNTHEVVLRVREKAQAPAREIAFAPDPISMIESAKRSVRVIEVGGKRLGVVHLWHFMSFKISTVLRDALEGPLADVDGLVLDVRGRGGSAGVIQDVLSVFHGRRATWKKPVVVLQDHGTRSAKEIFAWEWKRANLGPIVGQTSAGAVIGCTFKRLFDGSVLMHPVMDVKRMTRGETLEGKGVAPDVAVDPGDLRYRGGRDPILERGVAVLLERLETTKVARRFF